MDHVKKGTTVSRANGMGDAPLQWWTQHRRVPAWCRLKFAITNGQKRSYGTRSTRCTWRVRSWRLQWIRRAVLRKVQYVKSNGHALLKIFGASDYFEVHEYGLSRCRLMKGQSVREKNSIWAAIGYFNHAGSSLRFDGYSTNANALRSNVSCMSGSEWQRRCLMHKIPTTGSAWRSLHYFNGKCLLIHLVRAAC